MRILLYSVLIVFCLISCKGKEKEYEKPKWVERWDSLMTEAKPFIDSSEVLLDTISGTIYLHGGGSGTVRPYKPKEVQPAQGIVITNGGNPKGFLGMSKNGGGSPLNIDTIPKKDTDRLFTVVHDTSWSISTVDILESYFSISDSIGEVARRDSKTREWVIEDCKRALEVVYMLDSLRISELKSKNKQ